MSVDFVLLATACTWSIPADLPDRQGWVDVGNGTYQYQAAEDFSLDVGPTSDVLLMPMESDVVSMKDPLRYSPPPEITEQLGTNYTALSLSQQGGYSSPAADRFVKSVLNALTRDCQKAALDLFGEVEWLKR